MEEQEHDKSVGSAGDDARESADAKESPRYDPPVEARRGADGKLDIVPEPDTILGRDRAGTGRATDDDVESPSYGDEGGGQLYGEDSGDET